MNLVIFVQKMFSQHCITNCNLAIYSCWCFCAHFGSISLMSRNICISDILGLDHLTFTWVMVQFVEHCVLNEVFPNTNRSWASKFCLRCFSFNSTSSSGYSWIQLVVKQCATADYSVSSVSKYEYFLSRKYIWTGHLQNAAQFVQTQMSCCRFNHWNHESIYQNWGIILTPGPPFSNMV